MPLLILFVTLPAFTTISTPILFTFNQMRRITWGVIYDSKTEITIDLIQSLLPSEDYEYYLSGPQKFVEDLVDELQALEIADNRIHTQIS
ncbi:MAG: hypothetical protein HC921_16605 [Synechococcaceae cyanobacterium SM2_3_1]|nr:hypothetical protein [Synechococcaceae cyanobacterium SM2_3_1]